MAAQDRKISLKVKWFAAICIIIALIAVTFCFIQYFVNEQNHGTKSITKWGITFNEATSEAKFKFSQASLEENNHALGDFVSGTIVPPLAGETENTAVPKITGVTEKDLYITYDVDIDFPNDSFSKDGKFICPMKFDANNKWTKQKLHCEGLDFVNNKTTFKNELAKLGNVFKDIKVPAGTNMEKFMKEFEENCIISATSNDDFDTKGYNNVKIQLDYKFVISDEPNADMTNNH